MISIILPLKQDESHQKIKRCLDSLTEQTYQNFQVIIVTTPSLARKLKKLWPKYPFVRILSGDWNKSAARNAGAKRAQGEYLLHLDADMKLPATALAELAEKTKQDPQAIIVPMKGEEKVNFWGKCRALEKKLLLENLFLETPIFIKKSLFKWISGYDETLDPLDDWGLHLELERRKIKFGRIKSAFTLYESPTLQETIKRLFERGQALPALQEKYPQVPQISLKEKLKTYRGKWRLLLGSPLITAGLIFLKTIDFAALSWGKRRPQHPYILRQTAKTYENQRLGSNHDRYKHFAECQALLTLLGSNPGKILEVGAGTGRITSQLIKKGYLVIATDPSEAMLKEFRKKKILPRPIKAAGSQLPFKENQFEIVFGLRVFWHLSPKEQIKVLSEMSRVASRFVVFDIVNPKRLFASFFLGHLTYPMTLQELATLCQKKKLKIKKKIPLEVSLPFWLNLLPRQLAKTTFPFLYRLDLALVKFIPPGRYLVKLVKKE